MAESTESPATGHVRDVAFVMRCSLAAMLSFALASGLGLDHPLWACISALIVAQEKLVDTGRAIIWRMTGTVAGLVIAVASGTVLQLLHAPTWLQIGVAVAVAACLARIKNELRVAMWTAPIVFIMQSPQESLVMAGLWRASEVILGGLVGAALHIVFEWLFLRWQALRSRG